MNTMDLKKLFKILKKLLAGLKALLSLMQELSPSKEIQTEFKLTNLLFKTETMNKNRH